MILSTEELHRYDRQMLMSEFGLAGQEQLKQAILFNKMKLTS